MFNERDLVSIRLICNSKDLPADTVMLAFYPSEDGQIPLVGYAPSADKKEMDARLPRGTLLVRALQQRGKQISLGKIEVKRRRPARADSDGRKSVTETLSAFDGLRRPLTSRVTTTTAFSAATRRKQLRASSYSM